MRKTYIASSLIASLVTLNVYASPITPEEVEAAQKGWGEGIIAIGKAKDARSAAIKHIDKFYAYDLGTVLFKPTLAVEDQFRHSKSEALSYFVGGEIKEDNGFALAPYTNVRWENEGVITDKNSDMAMAMGNYFFTKTDGQEVKVEYTFGYIKDDAGNIKINLHHSSLPYSPK
ncbi:MULTISPECIES: hypothetical protein [Vibrio]|uniref:Phosphoribosyl-AMP cyclohydrolase n=2 Tax=Vibrio TaxID=662 RepID=A0A5P9CJI9_9VIBR|nr:MULTISPECIES: hypothetical protein [Vibrio]MYM60434.1 hypothetical protein [Vibrio tetraodonis subsp. pristinus]QFT26479.1 hypothetical protein FIV01_08565 [Vibrio aquimaris]